MVVGIISSNFASGEIKKTMVAFALYRLPYANEYVRMIQHEGQVEELHTYTELNGRAGFVMAPFSVSVNEPILLMHPDETSIHDINTEAQVPANVTDETGLQGDESERRKERERYAVDFANFHTHVQNHTFKKIVLARCKQLSKPEEVNVEQLFIRTCQLYPRMFVALVSMPQSGTWLMATPEILLEGNGSTWHTMALAGTMKLREDQMDFDIPFGDASKKIAWSAKDIEEQRFVATYINEAIEQFTYDYTEKGPYTCRAGSLVNLRSDFSFTLPENGKLGSFLNRLHPTPAVCGLPKEDVRSFILKNECSPRRYYSGFSGILNPDGETHLYVSLRCMEILSNRYILHAGGGLMSDSTEEKEWEETEAKMETMLQVIGYK